VTIGKIAKEEKGEKVYMQSVLVEAIQANAMHAWFKRKWDK
jgi:hypothetical protein